MFATKIVAKYVKRNDMRPALSMRDMLIENNFECQAELQGIIDKL